MELKPEDVIVQRNTSFRASDPGNCSTQMTLTHRPTGHTVWSEPDGPLTYHQLMCVLGREIKRSEDEEQRAARLRAEIEAAQAEAESIAREVAMAASDPHRAPGYKVVVTVRGPHAATAIVEVDKP